MIIKDKHKFTGQLIYSISLCILGFMIIFAFIPYAKHCIGFKPNPAGGAPLEYYYANYSWLYVITHTRGGWLLMVITFSIILALVGFNIFALIKLTTNPLCWLISIITLVAISFMFVVATIWPLMFRAC